MPITTASQRQALDETKSLVKGPTESLIPRGRRFFQQRKLYDRETTRGGLSGMHGLRHTYAQSR